MILGDIFVLKDNVLKLNLTGTMYRTVRQIIERDKFYGKKINAERYECEYNLYYAYLKLNRKKLFSAYRDSELEMVIRKRIGVDDNWRPYEQTEKLIKELDEDVKTVEEKMIDSLYKTAFSYTDLLIAIHENNSQVYDFLKKGMKDLKPDELTERQKLLNQVSDDFLRISKMTTETGTIINQISTYQDKIEILKRKDGKPTEKKFQDDRNLYKKRHD